MKYREIRRHFIFWLGVLAFVGCTEISDPSFEMAIEQGNVQVIEDESNSQNESSEMQFPEGSFGVYSVSPANGEIEVQTSTKIKITFSHVVNIGSLNDSSFIISGNGGNVSGTFDSLDTELIFSPTTNLSSNTTYQVNLSTDITNSSGDSLYDMLSWSFTTSDSESSSGVPKITSVFPKSDAGSVSTNSMIQISFDTKMLGNTFENSFTLSDSSSNTIDGSKEYDDSTEIFSFSPGNPLKSNESYTANVYSGVTTSGGVSLENEYGWNFTTESVQYNQYQTKLHPGDGANSDNFGTSLDVDETYIVVGAPYDDDKGTDSGSAYILSYNGSSWDQSQKLITTDETADDHFGMAVAIDDPVIVVGAPDYSKTGSPSVSQCGGIYIYKRSGSNWSLIDTLAANDAASSDYFGQSVAIDENIIAVGAPKTDDSGSKSGSVYIFFGNNGEDWAQNTELKASDGSSEDQFGFSLAMDGNYVIIGSPYDDDNGAGSGSAYIFYYDGASWSQQAKLTANNATAGDWFGTSVNIDGSYAIVGAPNHDSGGTNAGAVYIFKKNESNWIQETSINGSGSNSGMGISIAMNSSYAIVGADNPGYFYTLELGSTWFKKTLYTLNENSNNGLGDTVALNDTFAVFGLKQDNDNGTDSGAIAVFK